MLFLNLKYMCVFFFWDYFDIFLQLEISSIWSSWNTYIYYAEYYRNWNLYMNLCIHYPAIMQQPISFNTNPILLKSTSTSFLHLEQTPLVAFISQAWTVNLTSLQKFIITSPNMAKDRKCFSMVNVTKCTLPHFTYYNNIFHIFQHFNSGI